MYGKETIASSPGPMSVDRDALELFMKIALAAEPWRLDPSLTVKPWTPHTFTRPLKVAVQWWDGVVQPHPPMTRALREVAEACRKAGMEVVDWDCEGLDHKKGWEITSALYWPDGGEEILKYLEDSGEPILPLTKWIIHEQPTVKNLNMHELWKVSTAITLSQDRIAKLVPFFCSFVSKGISTAPTTHARGPKQALKTAMRWM